MFIAKQKDVIKQKYTQLHRQANIDPKFRCENPGFEWYRSYRGYAKETFSKIMVLLRMLEKNETYKTFSAKYSTDQGSHLCPFEYISGKLEQKIDAGFFDEKFPTAIISFFAKDASLGEGATSRYYRVDCHDIAGMKSYGLPDIDYLEPGIAGSIGDKDQYGGAYRDWNTQYFTDTNFYQCLKQEQEKVREELRIRTEETGVTWTLGETFCFLTCELTRLKRQKLKREGPSNEFVSYKDSSRKGFEKETKTIGLTVEIIEDRFYFRFHVEEGKIPYQISYRM